MAGDKYEKKMRLLPYIPYGLCSQLATAIEGKSNQYATTISLGNNQEELFKECEQHRKNNTERANYLCKTGITKSITRTCGTPGKLRKFHQITKQGLAALTEAPDGDDWVENIDGANDGNKKDTHFRSNSRDAADFRDILHEYATSDCEGDQQEFVTRLFEAVMEGKATPFAYAIDIAPKTRISTTKYSPNQLYKIWKLSHVNTMFQINGFLTCLDRRPYDHLMFDGIDSPDTYKQYIEKYGHTVASLTYYALSRWYSNPGIYKIDQQHPDTSEAARQEWLHTPVFYASKELPSFDDDGITNLKGSHQKLNAIYIGLAMGRNVNYLCYHGQQGELNWKEIREKKAQGEMKKVIRQMKTLNPGITNREDVTSALYFCTTHYQFTALFDRTIKRFKKGADTKHPMENPFSSVHIIPVNDTGTFLLWCLMEMSPDETESRICQRLIRSDPRFEYRMDHYYPLTYNGKRVFPGYTMDIAKINHVLVDYLEGQNFYIVCFPEQVVWYKKLFPTLTFL